MQRPFRAVFGECTVQRSHADGIILLEVGYLDFKGTVYLIT